MSRSPSSPRWRSALLILGLFTVLGLLKFGYFYLDDVTRGRHGTLARRLLEESTGAAGAALLFPLVIRLARRFPFRRGSVIPAIATHSFGATLISAAETTLRFLSRAALSPLVGLGAYDYGRMSVRYFMELPNDATGYAIVVAFVHLFDRYQAARERELRAAALEGELARAQLANLRLQLQPHFLFNALNTISSVMYEDPVRADRMLGGLSDLLRATLRQDQGQETTLGEELEMLELYLDLMRCRFEGRLEVLVSADSEVRSALVPALILQPLVENAIRHGFEPSGRGWIQVRCTRENGELRLEVRDRGPGLALPLDQALTRGVGLSNTASRLNHLYGGHRLQLDRPADGGLRAVVSLPYRVTG
jgi:signal transduction histidine kinase